MHSTLPILLGSLLLFGILENIYPFFTYKQSWSSRVTANFTAAVFNSLVTKVPVLWLLTLVWSPEQQKIWPGLLHYIPSTAVATVLSFAIVDSFRYGWHCMMHFLPIGWRFHRVHHSDLAMNISTAYRFNVIEVMASYVPMMFLVWLFGIKPEHLFIYEATFVVVEVFQHCNMGLPRNVDRLLSYLMVTPNYHRIHHSEIVEETDSNFSSVLTIWDRLFGTYRYCSDTSKIKIGLIEYPRPLNIFDMWVVPFKK